MTALHLTGGCNCGAVRYEITEPLVIAGYTDPGVRPSVRAFVEDAAPWKAVPDDGLPRYPVSRHAKP